MKCRVEVAMPWTLAGRVVSAMLVSPPFASATASGSGICELYWMVSPWLPRHSPDTQEFMALASIGDPAAENAAFLNLQTFGVGAKVSGTTSRLPQEQVLKFALKASWPIAKVRSCVWSLQTGGLASTLPPCAGTITSEQAWFWSQPRNWFSTTVLIKMSACPVPFGAVVAYAVFIGPNGPDPPVTPPLVAP